MPSLIACALNRTLSDHFDLLRIVCVKGVGEGERKPPSCGC